MLLCPQQRLTASDTASVEMREATTAEARRFMERVLDQKLYLTHYEKLHTPGPFVCNIIGIVNNLGDVFFIARGNAYACL